MNIVVLDGYTLNPGDLSWEGLKSLGKCVIHERTLPRETALRAAGAEILLTNKVVLSRDLILGLSALKYIGVLATGYNVVDIKAACERKIPVTNIPAYGTESVAQMVFAHLLNLCQQVGHHADTVRDGRWSGSADYCYWDYPLIELSGLTMGIIGFGRIGRTVARLAQAFNMRVLAYNPSPVVPEKSEGAVMVPLDRIFSESDVVSLHCPLTEENRGFVNAALLSRMKKTGFLINTSRGPLIDEAALARALNDGTIAGAGLDVLSQEPPPKDNPLLSARNCAITPHIAWATHAARKRLMDTAVGNVRAFLAGKTCNVMNPA